MSAYPELLDTMMEAILAGSLAPARTLYRDKKNFPPEAQLAVYVDGYRLRLREVVENAYPALLYYLGRPAFQALADAYVATTPSRAFNIDKYPIAFARYVAKESTDAFARELALCEGAIHDVYQRDESPAMDLAWVERQTPDSLASAPLAARTASQLLAFAHPVNAYLAAFRAGEKPEKPALLDTFLLVYRHHHQVQRMELGAAEYRLLSLLAEGKTLAEALEDDRFAPHALDGDISSRLMAWFGRWVREGALKNP